MNADSLNNPLLHRYWFKTKSELGYGVPAYSVEDAKNLMVESVKSLKNLSDIESIIEDVEISELDQNHVIPNMGPPNYRGVWFPCLNL
jgi:hypothetical protein